MHYKHLVSIAQNTLVQTIASLLIVSFAFVMLEPTVGRSQVDSNDFTITQTVSGAISFQTQPSDVTMVGTLDGLTGGTSYGTTTAVVRTNNAGGYNMTITFSSTTAMRRGPGEEATPTPELYNYLYSTGTASYPAGFDITPTNAQFGFSVNASNTADVSDVFTGTAGTACGTGEGTTFTLGDCWRGASETNSNATTELINRSTPTPASGSTTSVLFRITIPNSPNPAVPDGTYVATATLTATDN